ncbi:TIR domain-containing protein [Peribacillus sp. NPDC101481]|uniref:TIR domain-containing protein n=1 Tax=Peribacillus sp. NPDC101481 TaxID=3364403 RepID=UPI003826DD59
MKNLIFLSHAVADKDLVDRFVDFINIAFKIDRSQIYCTSLKGTKRIRTGNNFINDIKEHIEDTEVVLYFLTPNYLKSPFCLSELGAAWALGKRIYPILIPPLDYDELDSTPLKGVTQFIKLKDEESLFDIADDFKEMNILGDIGTGLLRAKAISFIKDMPELCKFNEDEHIDKHEYEKTQQEMREITENNIEQETEIRELKKKIEELKAAKDSKKVAEILLQGSNDRKTFDVLIENVKDLFTSLDNIVISSIYCNKYYIGEMRYWVSQDDFPRAQELEAEDYLIINFDDGVIEPNDSHPKIKKCIYALEELKWFLDEKCSSDFFNYFEDTYERPLSINNKWFWENMFKVRIIMS